MPRKADIPADLFLDEPEKGKGGEPAGKDRETLSRQKGKPASSVTRVGAKRVGRPPILQGPKEPVTLYLTGPAAHRLEEARYLLFAEHGLKTTKSALADYALRHALEDLTKVAEELSREQAE